MAACADSDTEGSKIELGVLEYENVVLSNIYDDNVESMKGLLRLERFGWCYEVDVTPKYNHFVPYCLIQNVYSYSREEDSLQKMTNSEGFSSSLMQSITSIKNLALTDRSGYEIMVHCKNFQAYLLSPGRVSRSKDIMEELQRRCLITDHSDLPCFHLSSSSLTQPKEIDYGWNLFNMEGEFNRMCVESKYWVKSHINDGFKLCKSYPELLYVPAQVANNILFGSSKFRSKQRFPVLTYYHEPSGGALCRSSQPLVGLGNKCKEDILLLQSIAKSSPNSDTLMIVDARPKINAMANKAKGKGFEGKHYSFCKFYFSSIENIHVMRESAQKLFQALYNNHDSYIGLMNAVESSGWLKHIKAILDASVFICNTLTGGTNVLVHCSDGWDRTSQTCAIACLLLDPFYRTTHGFIILIEKEFLSFGFCFGTRCQHLSGNNKNASPIFLQFLDCVWQIMRQFPAAFQFSERFLVFLSRHAYSCEYGTFIFDSVFERKKKELDKNTRSLWSINMTPFHNPLLDWKEHEKILLPQTSKDFLKLWTGCYAAGLNFPCKISSHDMVTDSLVQFKLVQYDTLHSTEDIAKSWQLPTYSTESCICGKMYSAQNKVFVRNCTNCFRLNCSECTRLTDQNQYLCLDCNGSKASG